MSRLWIVNENMYIWANSEITVKSKFEAEVPEEVFEKAEIIDNDTKVYLFKDEHGEEMWHWAVYDNATDIVETTVGEFFPSYVEGVQLPFVVSVTE